jgi:hypothetical protein
MAVILVLARKSCTDKIEEEVQGTELGQCETYSDFLP